MEFQKQVQLCFRTQLKLHNANHKQRAYHPHVTLAFRDLRKTHFYAAWEEFKDQRFQAEFEVTSFQLLKHNGTQWEVFHDYHFPG